MKVCCKLLVAAVLVFAVPSAVRASVGGNTTPKYSFGQIFAPNQTIDLIPSTSAAGNVWGVKCIIPSTSDPVDVKFTVDSGTVHTITLDPLYLEVDGSGNHTTGWVPMDIAFSTSIHVQIHNTSLTTGSINCFASWGTN